MRSPALVPILLYSLTALGLAGALHVSREGLAECGPGGRLAFIFGSVEAFATCSFISVPAIMAALLIRDHVQTCGPVWPFTIGRS
jgi:hypothetical protein